MTDRAPEDPERTADSADVDYHERLYLPWSWWAIGLCLGTLLAAETHMGHSGVRAWLPLVAILAALAGTLVWMGRLPVRVRDGQLWVDDAHLPLRFVADVEPLDDDGRRALLGPAGDPAAFVVIRPWVRRAVAVALDDPDDPTPYWLVSTRDPAALAAALDQARARARG